MATPSPTEAPVTKSPRCSFEGENCPCPNNCLDEDNVFSAMGSAPECTIEWETSTMCFDAQDASGISRSCTVDGYGYYCGENGTIEKSEHCRQTTIYIVFKGTPYDPSLGTEKNLNDMTLIFSRTLDVPLRFVTVTCETYNETWEYLSGDPRTSEVPNPVVFVGVVWCVSYSEVINNSDDLKNDIEDTYEGRDGFEEIDINISVSTPAPTVSPSATLSPTRSPTFPPTSPEEEGCIQILLGDSDYMENESQFRTCLCEYLDHVVPQSYFSVVFDFCDQWDNISSVQFLPGGIKGLESLGDNGVYDLQLDLRFLTKPVKDISSELNETIKQSPPTCAKGPGPAGDSFRPTFVQVCSPVEPVCPPESETPKSMVKCLMCCVLFALLLCWIFKRQRSAK